MKLTYGLRWSVAAASAWILLWAGAVVVGLGLVQRYDTTPGAAAAAPIHWPASSRSLLDLNRPTLIMLAHPQCPCTHTSLGELSEIMRRCHGRLAAYVLFTQPAGMNLDWVQSELWRSAEKIPGVHVLVDDLGAEARRLGAATSGHALLYRPDGTLLFSGGITKARGHAGDNLGRHAIETLLNGSDIEPNTTAVFGCPLFDQLSPCLASEGINPCRN